jgi:hypothetical protein
MQGPCWRPYVRLRPPAYVTRSRPRGSIGSPPGRGAVAQADRSAPDWVQTRIVTGPPPGSCPRPVHVLSWDLAVRGPDPAQGGGVRGPSQGSGHVRGGSGPYSEVRSVRTGVRHSLMGSGRTVDTLEYIVFSGRVATRESSTWWGRALFTTRLEVARSRMGIAPSHCSKGYPCCRILTVSMRVRSCLEPKYFKTMIYNCHNINTIVLLYITKTTVYYLIQRHVWCFGSELASLSSSDPIRK